MWVTVYKETGYEEATRAMRLSRGGQQFSDTIGDQLGSEDAKLMMNLLHSDMSAVGQPHTAGLRQVVFWLGINMPLYWWKQMDRYTVGTTQASSSTMYGLLKCDPEKPLLSSDFEGGIGRLFLMYLNYLKARGNWKCLNKYLPHSYLQERSMMISLPAMVRIISQRKNHKLVEWQIFINQVVGSARYPQLLT